MQWGIVLCTYKWVGFCSIITQEVHILEEIEVHMFTQVMITEWTYMITLGHNKQPNDTLIPIANEVPVHTFESLWKIIFFMQLFYAKILNS